MDARLLAQFPFLPEASAYVKGRGHTLEALIGDRAYHEVRALGIARVRQSLEDGRVENRPITTETAAEKELLTVPVARMLVSAVADPFLVRRYAAGEAVLARERLERADPALLGLVARQVGVELAWEGGLRVAFPDYLKNTSHLRDPQFKLVNRRLDGGFVEVDLDTALLLVESAVGRRIEGELPLPVNDAIRGAFAAEREELAKAVEVRKARYRTGDLGEVRITRFPPCMRKLLSMVQGGARVPHHGRFALVTFLHGIGMKNEEIYQILTSLTDYDERMTRYQVDHITGVISSTEYSVPECATMKSYGICFDPDELCAQPWMRHPMTYYRVKGRRREEPTKESASKPTPPAAPP